MTSLLARSSVFARALVIAVTAVAATGCGTQMIPNTQVPDTGENREVVNFVEQYRHAVGERDGAALLRLVSHEYFDDNGTPAADDDVDYDGVVDALRRWTDDVLDVRYDIRYRRVTAVPNGYYVDYTFIGNFKLRTHEGHRWSRRLTDNRIELRRERGELRIVSGL